MKDLQKATEKMLVIGSEFALDAVELVARSVRVLDLGLCVMLKLSIVGITTLGTLMGVAPEHVVWDVALLEMVGNVCMLFILVYSCAAIFCAMGFFCRPLFQNSWDSGKTEIWHIHS